ncbi:MAG: hypothetical protein IJ058_10005 [Lachnospiraceae bacterium]|nr:hypothetical protein [Lachnospiraceae bacterium]
MANSISGTMASTCPACGGTLVWNPEAGKLKCEYCDSEYTNEEVEAAWRDKEANLTEGGSADGDDANAMTTESMKEYRCSTCGADLMADVNTAVMVCPYCGNQTIAPMQFAGNIKPDYVVPFAHSKKEAEQKYLEYYNKRFLLPRSFKSDNHVEEIQGVYVPFWLFSGKINIDAKYVAVDEETDKEGHTHVTGRFQVRRQGHMSYAHVPTDASGRMDDALMDSIEPYELNDMKPFSLTYLPGFLAERYDVSEEDNRKRARERVQSTISSETRRTIRHDKIEDSNEQFRYENEKTDYALLPVWMLTTKWNDKTYKFAMNGQTGKMIGDLPISVPKFLAVIIPLFIILSIIGSYMTDGGSAGFVIAAVITVIVALVMHSSMKPVGRAGSATHYMTEPLKLTLEEEQKDMMLNRIKKS